jgi:hypothetical protein
MKERIASGATKKTRVAGHPPVAPIPGRTFDAGAWRLPNGKPLAEFALEAGFLAPLLFSSNARRPEHSEKKAEQA